MGGCVFLEQVGRREFEGRGGVVRDASLARNQLYRGVLPIYCHSIPGAVMLKDPRSAGPRPPFPEQQQAMPGKTAELNPVPDHGEHSYRGHDRLKGCVAIVTGSDSGIGLNSDRSWFALPGRRGIEVWWSGGVATVYDGEGLRPEGV